MKKFPHKSLALIMGFLTFFTLVGCVIYTKNAFDIVKCRTAEITRFKIDPDYYYHGKEKGMNDAWYSVELSNGASYKVNIQKYDTTYDFQFSKNEFRLFGYHLTGFLYENQLRNLFKQNFEEYSKITSFSIIMTHMVDQAIQLESERIVKYSHPETTK